MSQNSADLYIVLKLIDEGTTKLKAAMAEFNREQDKFRKKANAATESMTSGMRQAGAAIRAIRRDFFVAAVAIGTVMATTKEWSNVNEETHNALGRLTDNTKKLAGDIGSLLAPAIITFSDAVKKAMPHLESFFDKARQSVLKLYEDAVFGVVFWKNYFDALKTGKTQTEAIGAALGEAGTAAQEAGDRMSGALSANTTAQANALTDAVTNLFKTWTSWTDEVTQGDMILATSMQTALQAQISAYQNYYSTLAMWEDTDLRRSIDNMNAKTQAMQELMKMNSSTMQNIVGASMSTAQTFVNNFGDAMAKLALEGGKFKDAMEQVFKDMAKTFIAEVSKMIAKWLVFTALKGIFGGFGLFHEGGEVSDGSTMHHGGVIRAHQGLAVDEVPIIAQTGEGILSRRGMATLGGSLMLNSLNRGIQPYRATTQSPTVVNYTNYIDIKIDRPTVSTREDIDTLVEEVSRRVAQEVDRIR